MTFASYSERKTREAAAARLTPLVTIERGSAAAASSVQIANAWTERFYDGPYDLAALPPDDRLPAVSLVFVQSRDGNTGADNPEELGGGPVDKHLIYEGLSRVSADAVLAGAKTAEGEQTFFSIWHPEIVALRASLGLPRHPAQVVVTGSGCLDVERTLLFNAAGAAPVYVLAAPDACRKLEAAAERPGIEVVPIEHDDLRAALAFLRRERGIRRISCIGGRTTASALIDAGLVQDIALTTTSRTAGEPGTPFYVGKQPPDLQLIVRKRGMDPEYPMVFEQWAIKNRKW